MHGVQGIFGISWIIEMIGISDFALHLAFPPICPQIWFSWWYIPMKTFMRFYFSYRTRCEHTHRPQRIRPQHGHAADGCECYLLLRLCQGNYWDDRDHQHYRLHVCIIRSGQDSTFFTPLLMKTYLVFRAMDCSRQVRRSLIQNPSRISLCRLPVAGLTRFYPDHST